MASDCVTPAGTHLDRAIFTGQATQRQNSAGIRFPRQRRPNKASWQLWRRALRLLFTAPCSADLVLLEPLGTWYPLRADSQKWKYYKSADTLIVRVGPVQLVQYQSPHLQRRKLRYTKSRGSPIPSLPRNSVPADPPTQNPLYWRLPAHTGLDARAPLSIPDRPVTFSDRVAALD